MSYLLVTSVHATASNQQTQQRLKEVIQQKQQRETARRNQVEKPTIPKEEIERGQQINQFFSEQQNKKETTQKVESLSPQEQQRQTKINNALKPRKQDTLEQQKQDRIAALHKKNKEENEKERKAYNKELEKKRRKFLKDSVKNLPQKGRSKDYTDFNQQFEEIKRKK